MFLETHPSQPSIHNNNGNYLSDTFPMPGAVPVAHTLFSAYVPTVLFWNWVHGSPSVCSSLPFHPHLLRWYQTCISLFQLSHSLTLTGIDLFFPSSSSISSSCLLWIESRVLFFYRYVLSQLYYKLPEDKDLVFFISFASHTAPSNVLSK